MWPKHISTLIDLDGGPIMYTKSHYLVCFALAVVLSGLAQAAALAPDDSSIKDNLCLWLRNPGVNFDEAAGIWSDASGRGNDARAMGLIDAWGIVYSGPILTFGSNPALFNGEFSAVKFSGDVDDLMRADNINGGSGLSQLTIVAIYKLYNQDQSGAGMTRAVGIGSFTGEGANLGDYFNLANDVSIRKDNGSILGATEAHPDDTFFIRSARMNPSSIDQWFNTDGRLRLVHNATGVSYTTSVDNFYLGDIRADNSGGGPSGYSRSDIEIAEVVVYNTDLTEVQIEGINEWLQANIGSGGGNPLASSPNPADGAILEATWANISWRAGYYAVSHDVYFGASFNDVNQGAEGTFIGNTMATYQVVGFPGFPAPEGLQPGTTYYWRVDEVNDANAASPWKGNVWSFSIPPNKAYNPDPADGSKYIDPNVILSWNAGMDAKLHHLYFGDNFDDVNSAVVGQPLTDTTYTPGTLALEKTYYWRVDEFDGITTHKGDVWNFTIMPVISVTDDPNFVAWWKLDEGMGKNALDWSGHSNHGTLFGPKWIIPGLIGNAALNLNNGYVAIRNLNYNRSGMTGVTVCAWIRTKDNATQFIASFDRDQYWRLELNGSGGGPGQVGWSVMTSAGQVDYGSVTRVDNGLWHHITGVFDNGTLTVYIDGNPEPSVTGGLTFGSGNLRYGFIGANSEATSFNGSRGNGSPINGEIDDLRIYDRALTADEVKLAMRGDMTIAWDPSPANGSTSNLKDAIPLSWSAGNKSSQHDVYFGTDRGVVIDADSVDATGIYRGRQSAASYTPPEGVEWGGGPYYWRVDEYNTDGTTSKGSIWSFSVADYIGIDDFEGYTDNDVAGEAIWQTWTDGYGIPTNGAQVGNLFPPYAEQTIVHSGLQSMPVIYDNTAGVINSEVALPLTNTRDFTEEGVKVLSLWFRGYPPSVGSFMEGPAGTYTMTGSGAEIGGTADQFHFAYKMLTGAGSIVAKVESVENTNSLAKAGVMIRETLDPNSKNAFACITADSGVISQGRTEAGSTSYSATQSGIAAPHWIKLERDVAGNFTAYQSINGSSWEMVENSVPQNILMNSNTYVGLAVTSRNAAVPCEAKFSNVQITGTVSQQWMHQDIGITSNVTEPMYVALSNGAGTPALVYHDDPNAATISTWTEWTIDLQKFADQGVNLTNVDKIALGLGSKGNVPAPSGSGTMYFDDIRLYKPAPTPEAQ